MLNDLSHSCNCYFQISSASDSPIEAVRSHSVAVCQYFLTVKRPSAHVEVAGMLSYHFCVDTPQTAQFSYKLPLTSFIRWHTFLLSLTFRLWGNHELLTLISRFAQTFERIYGGVRDDVARLHARYKTESDTDRWWPGTSRSQSECTEGETPASHCGNHWWIFFLLTELDLSWDLTFLFIFHSGNELDRFIVLEGTFFILREVTCLHSCSYKQIIHNQVHTRHVFSWKNAHLVRSSGKDANKLSSLFKHVAFFRFGLTDIWFASIKLRCPYSLF